MGMHDIEKQVLIEKIFATTWRLYSESVIGGYMVKHSIVKPRLQCICKGISAAGMYFPRNAIVEINTAYYNGGDISNLECTIAHELAHHIAHCIWPQSKQWHGPEFRFVMDAIGMNGDTYHHMSRRVAKAVASKSKDELFEF